jgi:hypothetical protein
VIMKPVDGCSTSSFAAPYASQNCNLIDGVMNEFLSCFVGSAMLWMRNGRLACPIGRWRSPRRKSARSSRRGEAGGPPISPSRSMGRDSETLLVGYQFIGPDCHHSHRELYSRLLFLYTSIIFLYFKNSFCLAVWGHKRAVIYGTLDF